MYKITIPDYVMEDVFDIKEYIFRMSFSIEVVNKIYNEIMASIVTLKVFPLMYPVFKWDLRVMTIRKKYRVFYEIKEENKEIIIQYIFWVEEDYYSLIH